ncbi:BTB/POZ domain-containing protein KCTD7-like [Ruditapes philippinarum]|uniref:BTB/POZ domain-containing protein KCTD7-like n=1 Tax=Ruditapes philippinarum TaxID=129788 RepID=UPI00295B1CC8|nr:BTB/POZ domain-containing protein KCTD7-like [Ruditapes philippinarum]
MASQVHKLVKLNVGGTRMTTTAETLMKDPGSKLANMLTKHDVFHKDSDGSFFIDCEAEIFKVILNFLRFGTLPKVEKVLQLYDVAKHLNVQSLIDKLKSYHAVKYENQMASLHQRFSNFEGELGKVIKRIEEINAAPNEAKAIHFFRSRCEYCFSQKYELKACGTSIYANIFMNNMSVDDEFVALLAYNLCKLGYAKQIAKRRYNEPCKGNPHGYWHDGLQLILLTN